MLKMKPPKFVNRNWHLLLSLLLTVSESGRVDSGGGGRTSANRSAGRARPIIPDNDDSYSFGGSKEVGEFSYILFLCCIFSIIYESRNQKPKTKNLASCTNMFTFLFTRPRLFKLWIALSNVWTTAARSTIFYQLKIRLGILVLYNFVLHDGVALFR